MRLVVSLGLVCAWLGTTAGDAAADQPAPAQALRSPRTLKVCVQPLAPFDKGLLGPITRGIEHVFGFEVVVLPTKPLPKRAYYKPRKRYRADKVLDYLTASVAPGSGCFAVMGFTKRDVSTTKGRHVDWGVLGLGTLGGPAAVVSSFRMRRAPRRKVMKRAVKVVNHELGHVLGLDHYNGKTGDGQAGCMMNDARGSIRTVDREKGLPCAPSRAYIERKHRIALPVRARVDWKRVLAQ